MMRGKKAETRTPGRATRAGRAQRAGRASGTPSDDASYGEVSLRREDRETHGATPSEEKNSVDRVERDTAIIVALGADPGANQTRLASSLGMSRAALQRAIARLERNGHLALASMEASGASRQLASQSASSDAATASDTAIGNTIGNARPRDVRDDARRAALRALPVRRRVAILARIARGDDAARALRAIELLNELSGLQTRREDPAPVDTRPMFALPEGTMAAPVAVRIDPEPA